MVIELLAKKKDYFELLINNNCNRRFKKQYPPTACLRKATCILPRKSAIHEVLHGQHHFGATKRMQFFLL
jgi:hypothetical protein